MIRPCPDRVDCPGSDFPLRNLSSEGPDLPQYSATGFCCNGQQAWAFSLVSQENADDALFRLLKTSCPECTEARQYCAEAKCPDGTVLAKYCSPISQEVVDEWAAQREALMLPFCDDTSQLFSATCACPDGSNPVTMFSPFSVDDALAACESSRTGCPPVANDEQVCAARCPDGTLFYWVVATGTVLATTLAEANAIAYALACERAEQFKVCISGPDPSACLNVAYSSVVTASTVTQITWQVLGSFPAGLTGAPVGLNGYRIQGIPTTSGIYPLTFVATNTIGNYAVKTVSIRVWGISDTSLPAATFGDLYSYQLTSVGGTPPYAYILISGLLPLGMDITSTGLISGICGEVGVFNPEIKVIDSAGRSCTKTFDLTITDATRWVHWPMESLTSGKLVDCILGVQDPFTVNTGIGGLVDYAFDPGIQNNALHFYYDVSGNLQVSMGVPTTSIPALKHDGNGFSLCAWVKINSYGDLAGTGYGSITYVGALNNCQVRLYFKNGQYIFNAKDSSAHNENVNVVLPATGAWFFLHMFQDIPNGKMGIQFNNGPITYASFTPIAVASTGGLVQIYQAAGGWVPNDWLIDEVSVRLDACFTAAQLAYLYNSGAGRTCPMTLP